MWNKIADSLYILSHPVDSIQHAYKGMWSTSCDLMGISSFFVIMLSMLLWQMGWDEGAKKLGYPAMLVFILSGVFS